MRIICPSFFLNYIQNKKATNRDGRHKNVSGEAKAVAEKIKKASHTNCKPGKADKKSCLRISVFIKQYEERKTDEYKKNNQ